MQQIIKPSIYILLLSMAGICLSFRPDTVKPLSPQEEFCNVLTAYVVNAPLNFSALKGEKDLNETKTDVQVAYRLKSLILPPFKWGYVLDTKGNFATTCLNLRAVYPTNPEMNGNYEELCANLEECLPSTTWNSLRKGKTTTYQQSTAGNDLNFVTIQVNPQPVGGATHEYWLDLRMWFTKKN